jgi:hypothetical protein
MNLVDYSSNQIVDREGGSKQWDSGSYERIRFRNGYGASIITGGSAYGRGVTLEIAVIRFLSESCDDFELCYDTPVTSDVIGHLSHYQARGILEQIAALPPDAKALPGAMLDYES